MRNFLIGFLLLSYYAVAQQVPVGSWQSFNPHASFQAVTYGDGIVYAGSVDLMSFNTITQEYDIISKVNGLSDARIGQLGYNAATRSVLITYLNSNIDILKDDQIYNLPDLLNANIIASKKINSIKMRENLAYLSTGLGIVIINMDKREIKSTYPMIYNGSQSIVLDIEFADDSIYAFTDKGVFAAREQSPFLEDITRWKYYTQSINFNKTFIRQGKIYGISADKIYEWHGQSPPMQVFDAENEIKDVCVFKNKIYVASLSLDKGGYINVLDYQFSPLNKLFGYGAVDLESVQDYLWIADTYVGLRNLNEQNESNVFNQQGPGVSTTYNLRVIPPYVFAMHGGTDLQGNGLGLRSGMSIYNTDDGSWKYISQFNGYPQLDSMLDLMDVAKNPQKNEFFVTSYGGGMFTLTPDWEIGEVIKGFPLGENLTVPNNYLGTSIIPDNFGNLWLGTSHTSVNLAIKDRNNKWHQTSIPLNHDFRVLGDMIVDNGNQLWVVIPRSIGLAVLDNNKTLDKSSDDKVKIYRSGAGTGNLANNNVYSIAKDNDGRLWVGTENGISIINCPEAAFSSSGCEAENKIVQYDQFAAGRLFSGELVKAIAVDEANRKWVGTMNGLWLISEDAEKVIHKFTTTNSPLPSNEIQEIAIDHRTGIVYIATTLGIVAYRGTAINGSTPDVEPITFPNPVESNYNGPISIKNLIDDAIVKIVDGSGKLVYQASATGGQLVWNGKTYTGATPQSGIYYILATSRDGSKRQNGKFILLEKNN